MTRVWLNGLSIAALLAACVLAVWLWAIGSGISFFMSDRDPFPNAEDDVMWLLFVGPLVAAGIAFASRILGLALMTISLLVGFCITSSTGCLGHPTTLPQFTCGLFRWEHAAIVGLTFLSLLFRRQATRRSIDLADAP